MKIALRSVITHLATMLFFLAAISSASAQVKSQIRRLDDRADISSDIVVKEFHIAVLKQSLNLRPTQERYWIPIEVALRDMAHWQATAGERGVNRPAVEVAARVKRISAVAAPLMKTLDEQQKAVVTMLARSAGLDRLLMVDNNLR